MRLIVGLSMATLVLVALCVDGWLSSLSPAPWTIGGVDLMRFLQRGGIATLLLLGFSVATTHELLGFAKLLGYRPQGTLVHCFSAGLVVGPYVAFNLPQKYALGNEAWGMLWLALALGLTFFLQAVRRGTERTMVNLATSTFIIFYCGGLAGFLTKLRMEVGGPLGIALLVYTILVVKMTDTGAYFTGRLLGRNKMVPWLSPKKTWEGFVGGLVTAIAVAILVGFWLQAAGFRSRDDVEFTPSILVLASFGLLMGLFSVAGDLSASLLKRDAEVKDSGTLPGLGGVLDVLDSPLMAAPVAWFFWTRLVNLGLSST